MTIVVVEAGEITEPLKVTIPFIWKSRAGCYYIRTLYSDVRLDGALSGESVRRCASDHEAWGHRVRKLYLEDKS